MKKSKLLILIPLVALTMSGCDFSFLSSSSDTNASTESRVDEGSTSYESYTLLYGFYYQGNLESIPEDTSLYLYGDLVGDTFTPLEANSNGYYGTTLKDIEYGTYSYSLYIDYNTNEISLESPLICSGEETVSSASSSGGNLFITLTSSFNELLGEATTPGETPEETTYTIEVDNAEALSNLTYDSNAATQTSVDLQVYLVTTPSVGNPERIAASETDVELSNYAETIISVSGLTVTPEGAGSTSITISKDGYQSTSVEVYVSDITVTGENNQITLYFTFKYEGSAQTIPDNAKVYICGGWDGGDWSTENVPTLQYDSNNECYYAVITYSEDVMNNHWYNYNLYLAGINDSFSWDLTKLCSDNLWWTHESDSYTKSEEIILSDTFESLLNGSTSEDTGSGTTDGGKPDATYIHNFTLVVTIYDSTGNTVKKAPSGYDLYIAGDMDGTWEVNDSYDPSEEGSSEGWYNWCSPVKLEETTDESGNLAYTYTFGYVEENSWPNYNIYYTTSDSEFSWDYKLGSADFSFAVDSGATDNYTQYITCNIDSNLDDFMVNASDTSAGGDEGTGGDTGDTGTVTELTNYNLSFTLTYNGSADSVPEGMELRIIGSWDNDSTWNNYHVLTQVGNTYQYTIDSIAVLGEEDQWYNYDLLLGYPNDSSINWDYQLKFAEGNYTTFGVYSSEGNNYTNNISLELSNSMSSLVSSSGSGSTTISEYTLTLNIYYGSSLEALPTWADLYINGSWANSDELGWYNFEKLTPDESRTTFTLTISDVYPGWYDYALVMVKAGETPDSDWSNTHRITPDGSNGYFEIVTGTTGDTFSYTTSTALSDIFSDPDAETSYTNHVISITLTDNSGNVINVPSWVSVYAEFNFDSWTLHELTRVNDNTFTYTVDTITSGSYNYTVDVDYTGDELTWGSHQLAGNVAFTIEKDNVTNQTDITLVTSLDFATEFPERGDTGDTGDESGDGTISVYFLIIDISSATSTDSIDWCFNFTYDVNSGTDGIFKQNGDSTESEKGGPWYNWSNATGVVATISGTTHVAVYNYTVGEMNAGDEVWMNLKNWNSTSSVWQSYYFDCKVPTDSASVITFVGYANLGAFTSTISSSFSNEVTMTVYSGTPTEVLATLY